MGKGHAGVTGFCTSDENPSDIAGAPQKIRTSDLRLRRPSVSGKKKPKFANRDGAVTAIRRALEFIAARDPLALAAAVHAMEVALGVLLAEEGASGSAGSSGLASPS
jgi:hypothetical protein